ncbi:MAG: glycosyltransferase family 2 protein [Chitinophagaceae bacterium]
MQNKIGIITVLYNSESVLNVFFNTLNKQIYKNFILYIIDNHSPDNSLSLAKNLSKNVFFNTKFIECKENNGVAKGNNLGIKEALQDNCNLILLSNNDIQLFPNTISNLLEGKNKYKADLVVPKIYAFNTNILWFAGGKFRYIKISTPHLGYGKKDIGQYNIAKKIKYAPTCFMLMDKKIFETVGLMDEKFFVYCDDTDFIYRCNKNKKILFYIPSSIIQHKESTSTGGKKSDFYIYYQNRNAIYFALKHYSFIHQLVIYFFYITHLFLVKLFLLNFHQWKLCLKAHIDGVKLYLK